MYPHSMFWAKIRKIIKNESENYHFYSREILLYIAWAFLRNDSNEPMQGVQRGLVLSLMFSYFQN